MIAKKKSKQFKIYSCKTLNIPIFKFNKKTKKNGKYYFGWKPS